MSDSDDSHADEKKRATRKKVTRNERERETILFNGVSDGRLTRLAKAFEKTTVSRWATGVVPASTDELRLFFIPSESNMDESRVINYPYSEEAVGELRKSCSKASFGKGTQEVLDETYRKAGKLDFGRFSWLFNTDVLATTIRSNLMPLADDTDLLKFELYKLNVYGKGSFFKSHKDTPRGNNMFASLVLVLPSHHTGGELVLRHGEEEYVFDAAVQLKDLGNHIAYAVFYSDVDHEVREVTEGDRITITYNLYWTKGDENALLSSVKRGRRKQTDVDEELMKPRPGVQVYSSPFERELRTLLSEREFLTNGGMLGFALQHLYPMPTDTPTYLISPRLKGLDAVIAHTCLVLGLKCNLRFAYYEPGECILTMKKVVQLYSIGEQTVPDALLERGGTALTYKTKDFDDEGMDRNGERVHWVTYPESQLKDRQSVGTYGNSPSSTDVYSSFVLIVGIGPADDRTAHGKIPPLEA